MASTRSNNPDILIIGAGSAGSVLANRLSEDNSTQVCLLEAGGHDLRLMIRMPSAFYMPVKNKQLNWGYESEPAQHLNHRRLLCPRGRVLGGSSSINGMVYVRGHPQDFDRWAEAGASDWDYRHVLPYFNKAQRFQSADNDHTTDPLIGYQGPLTVTEPQLKNPLYQTFLQGAKQAGYPLRKNLNDSAQEGFGPLPMTVKDGIRASTAQAYLQPVRRRNNLKIETHAHVHRLEVEGQRIRAVHARVGGRDKVYQAEQVVLCAGAINSPQLLMLSGIGDPDQLSQVGIAPKIELPGVGKNLMDHLEVYVQQACTQPISLYKDLSLLGRGKIGVQWLLQQKGLGATNHFEAGGFIKSKAGLTQPDIQFHFLPAAMQYDGSAKANLHGFQAHVGPMLSASRGTISLADANPNSAPRIEFNYMSTAEDWRVFRHAIRAARDIFAQTAFDDVRGDELRPGMHCQDDASLDKFIRAHAESAYHPCGSCRMGADSQAVVDNQARVHGLDNLRVVDASIFPHITNGNINAPVIMVAERIADLMRGQCLAPADI